MSTLSIERTESGAYWLVLHRAPNDAAGKKIAVFASRAAVDEYKDAFRDALSFARTSEESGI